MSAELSGIVARKIAGGAARRCLLRTLADQANNDGSGIYATVPELARDSEISDRSVQTHLKAFIAEGLLQLVGQRDHKHGKTNEYWLLPDALEALPDIDRTPPAIPAPVKPAHRRISCTGETPTPVKTPEFVESQALTVTGENPAPVKLLRAQQKERSPTPPKEKLQPLSEPIGSSRGYVAPRSAEGCPAFMGLWALWGRADGVRRSKRKLSFEAYQRILRTGVPHALIERGLAAYLADPNKTKDQGQFMPAFERWLKDEIWRDWAEPQPIAAKAEPSKADWAKRLEFFQTKGRWMDDRWGPPPGSPGYLGPPMAKEASREPQQISI